MNTRQPGDRLAQVLEHVERIAYLHRASAQIQAGWNVKLSDMQYKLSFARHTFEDMEQASKLDRHIWAMTRMNQYQPSVPSAWIGSLRDLDAATDEAQVITGLYRIVKPKLLDLYRTLLLGLHPVMDYNLERILNDHIQILERQIDWGNKAAALINPGNGWQRLSQMRNSMQGLVTDSLVPRDQALWEPLDRVDTAVRPAHLPRAIPGALHLSPANGWTDPEGIGLAMHHQMHGEFTTMELTSRCLYEHPDMPSAFHLDMARHASDESRHVLIFQELANEYGVTYGDYPIYTLTYDGYYDFSPACASGSRDELLWRLILRGTIDEGLALDDLAFQANSRSYLEQEHIVAACRYILADETLHVQGALKWSRYLCNGDEIKVSEVRETARQFLNQRLFERRFAFEQQHERALEQELAQRRELAAAQRATLPFTRILNKSARMAAGYTEQDLAQVVP